MGDNKIYYCCRSSSGDRDDNDDHDYDDRCHRLCCRRCRYYYRNTHNTRLARRRGSSNIAIAQTRVCARL